MGASCSECAENNAGLRCMMDENQQVVPARLIPNKLQSGRTSAGHHWVELAVTSIGPSMPGLQAYHTSVVVDSMEYSFGPQGLVVITVGACSAGSRPVDGFGSGPRQGASHRVVHGPGEVLTMGLSPLGGRDMFRALKGSFKKGTYDLLRKNCNSFTDCALTYLLDLRLDNAYRGLENFGLFAEQAAGMVKVLSRGGYSPNPKADGFIVNKLLQEIQQDRRPADLRALEERNLAIQENALALESTDNLELTEAY